MKIKVRWLAMYASWMAAALLSGCGGSSDSGNSEVRLVNASPDSAYSSLDLYVDGVLATSGVSYGGAGSYATVSAATHTTAITVNGSTTPISSSSRAYGKGAPITLIAYGWQGALKTAALSDTQTTPASGYANLLVFNSAIDAGSVDVYVNKVSDTSTSLATASGVAYSVSGGAAYSGGFQSIAAGIYRIRVTAAGDTNTVLMDVTNVSLTDQQVTTLVLTPSTGGALVGGMLINQGGTVTTLATTQARARVVSAVTPGATVAASFNGTVLASAATAPVIGSYTLVTAGSQAPVVSVTPSGSSSATTVAATAQTLVAGGDYTLLVWGSASAPQLTWISDDNRLPSSSSTVKIRLVHGISDVTTGASATLDYSSFAQGVTQGSASAYNSSLASGTHTSLIASVAGNSAFFSINNTSFTLASKGVYTVFLLGSLASPQGALYKER